MRNCLACSSASTLCNLAITLKGVACDINLVCAKTVASRRASVDNLQLKKGINPAWSNDFYLMLPTDDGLGTFCSLCRKHNRHPKKYVVERAIWTDVPCQLIQRHALVKHSLSESYLEAVKMESTLTSLRGDGEIRVAFEHVAS